MQFSGGGGCRVQDAISLWWVRLRYPVSAFFTWLALVVGLIAGIATIIQSVGASTTLNETVFSVALAAITIISLGALAYRETRLSGHQNFASTLSLQNHASERLRDLRYFLRKHAAEVSAGRAVPSDTLGRVRSMIEEVLTAYSDIYSIWTSTRCRTCVKLIDIKRKGGTTIDPESVIVFALARDKYSAKENQRHDKDRAERGFDKLQMNSDFLRLWDPEVHDDGYFLSNDLRKEHNYDTSSLNYYRNVAGNPNRVAANDWPLWYRSAIVWPIRQEPRDDLGITEQTCLGFLSVDSRVPGILNSEEHPYLGKILANALYPILDLYTQIASADHAAN